MASRSSLRPAAARRVDEDRILPLINIVFLLLIFFVLAGRLAVSDPFKVDPPPSISDEPSDPGELEILIGRDGRLAIDGLPVAEGDWERALDERLAEGAPAQARIKADGAALAGDVMALAQRLSDAGTEDLHVQTRRLAP